LSYEKTPENWKKLDYIAAVEDALFRLYTLEKND